MTRRVVEVSSKRPRILDILREQVPNAVIFDDARGMDANLIAERRLPGRADAYDDIAHFVARPAGGGPWFDAQFRTTCDPGRDGLIRHINRNGTWITQPGQYRSAHVIGLHNRKPALVQRRDPPPAGVLRGWRDRNNDGTVNRSGPTFTDGHGVNWHQAGDARSPIGPWSLGCTATPRTPVPGWFELWALIEESAAIYGPIFTTSLVEV